MQFTWTDYGEAYYDIVETWMDETAKRESGCDEGWREYYEAVLQENDTYHLRENFWCKVISADGTPFACMSLFHSDEGKLSVWEFVVAPEFRGRGYGSEVLQELIHDCPSILGFSVTAAETVIFPSNIASQRIFEKAGFRFTSAHPDGDAWYYTYSEE